MGSAQAQSELWGRHAEIWSNTLEQQMRPLFVATMRALEPLRGKKLLDAGCGAGLALSEAAARGAHVWGLDATEPLLAVARRRIPSANLRQGDIQDMPFVNETFDAVTAFNSIQYATDPAVAVAELARVCRSGGTVAIGIWGDPRRCETEGLFGRLRSLAPPPPGTPAPLACSEAGVVEELLVKAGLQPQGGAEVPTSFLFGDLDQAWTAHTSSGPLQKVIDSAGADAVRATMDAVLEADRKPDGSLRQDNIFRFVLATKL
jgi:SAM-dependent methyltransferase